ncbi:N-acetylglucosamine-1-phosphate uridyltransferase [Xaviernesmea oryzae]|uniref:N-acetylglucosamine-1-phosphate uridyltransferase n=1 Tax=Xaviernesmea oryzae TaxID=464029 RepID=A0A1Q9ARL1_9HYPH|nr:FAD-dependent oxidoreductase [Xaviernesmea oryzae]OLP58093.1 N-acetylglucosamine-1-phosphate uridyltransferase [Xaviernesmea oryzae]SEL83060.1 Glycine/D-amino acid oxidase [Xaviernesmea oryzae]
MSVIIDTENLSQDDLHNGRSPWGAAQSPPRRHALRESMTTDVLVIGGGITGSLVAEHLVAHGHQVVLADCETPGLGSTAASTAMLQWEIDEPLKRLTDIYDFEAAAEIYRKSFSAVQGLTRLVAEAGIDCQFSPRATLYIAADGVGHRDLEEEAALRGRAGLPSEFVDGQHLQAHFGFRRDGAILSPGSADADPLLLSWGLLRRAERAGLKLVDAKAETFDADSRCVQVEMSNRLVVEARHVVLATGYIMPDFVKTDLHSTVSSWALATVPQTPQGLWPGLPLVWEASEDYHYMRATADGRIVIGGEDDDTQDHDERAAKTAMKQEKLLRVLAELCPGANQAVTHAWAGAFGTTEDGLPLIGRVPGHSRIYAAYGYGGNGITFSYMASRMLAAEIAGQREAWFDRFAIDRPVP